MFDVTIPIYNQPKLVEQCLDAVLHQRGVDHIIIIDDASTDTDLLEYLGIMAAHHKKILLVSHSQNVGFAESANHGAALIMSEYGIIINSDTVPMSPDSCYTMMMSLDQNGANVCGAKLLFATGSKYGMGLTIQHAGVAFDPALRPYHPFMHLHRNTAAANKPKFVTAVTGAVFGIRMSMWRTLGGFSAEFAPGVYEDVDYCLKVRKVYYEPASEWLHLMHGSQTKDNDLFSNADDHLKLLVGKWKGKVICDEILYYGV